jgi:hypothetical protein
MADTKPGDLLLGVSEFFAILLPGAALVYLIQPWTAPRIPLQLRPSDDNARWVVFLVLAYLVGHVLHAFSSRLDKSVYDSVYLPRAASDHYRAVQLVKETRPDLRLEAIRQDETLRSTLYGRALLCAGDDAAGTSLYDWCLSLIRLQNSAAAAEVDRHQANSKFFRSLSFVMLAAVWAGIKEGSFTAAVASGLTLLFSIWRFCTLRWDATRRVYEFYLLLHQYPPPAGDSSKSPR